MVANYHIDTNLRFNFLPNLKSNKRTKSYITQSHYLRFVSLQMRFQSATDKKNFQLEERAGQSYLRFDIETASKRDA